jgi:hypothetical protein
MQGPVPERWRKLCEQAAKEQDPDQLLKLIQEINRMLYEQEDYCNGRVSGREPAA